MATKIQNSVFVSAQHTAHCQICGRKLTNPASIIRKMGPVCAKKQIQNKIIDIQFNNNTRQKSKVRPSADLRTFLITEQLLKTQLSWINNKISNDSTKKTFSNIIRIVKRGLQTKNIPCIELSLKSMSKRVILPRFSKNLIDNSIIPLLHVAKAAAY